MFAILQAAQKDPYADFASVFDKFASAEEVTGAVKAEPEEEEAADEAEEAPQAAPLQVPTVPALEGCRLCDCSCHHSCCACLQS